ncbi:DEAD/DEAH box helicase family protein [Salmonella enterica]|nr:DEAD/DEAH box helicase family protein [Salmonella enterica]
MQLYGYQPVDLKNDQCHEKQLKRLLLSDEPLYPQQVENIERVAEALYEQEKRIVIFDAPMQSGKTGLIRGLAALHPVVRGYDGSTFYRSCVMVISAMSDVALKDQTVSEVDMSNVVCVNGVTSQIKAALQKRLNVGYSQNHKECLVIIDEAHYASKESSAFIKSVKFVLKNLPDAKLVLITATGFGIQQKLLDEGLSEECESAVMSAKTASTYYGVTEMMANKQMTLIPKDQMTWEMDKDDVCKAIKAMPNGISLLRATAGRAQEMYDFVRKQLGDEYELYICGGKGLKGVTSTEAMRSQAEMMPILGENVIGDEYTSKIVVIVIGTFKAGINVKHLKPFFRVLYESGKDNAATCLQGLVGRACGYYKPTDLKIYAVEEYVRFYRDYMAIDPMYLDAFVKLAGKYNVDKFDVSSKVKRLDKHGKKIDWKYTGHVITADNMDTMPEDVQKVANLADEALGSNNKFIRLPSKQLINGRQIAGHWGNKKNTFKTSTHIVGDIDIVLRGLMQTGETMFQSLVGHLSIEKGNIGYSVFCFSKLVGGRDGKSHLDDADMDLICTLLNIQPTDKVFVVFKRGVSFERENPVEVTSTSGYGSSILN